MRSRISYGSAFVVLTALLVLGVWQVARTGPLDAGPAAQETKPSPTPPPGYQVPPPTDPHPDAGLTEAERMERIREGSAEADARRQAFLEWFAQQDVDLHSLPRAEWMGDSPEAPRPDLATAVADADVIVLGTVEDITYRFTGIVVTVTVDRAVKGEAGATVRIAQPGGPERVPSGGGQVVLGEVKADPLLLPGDRAVLFLTYKEDAGLYNVQLYTGQYRSHGGRVEPIADNPFGQAVADLAEGEFLRRVEEIAKKR